MFFFYSNDTGFNALLVSFCAGAGSTRNPHFPKSPEEPKFHLTVSIRDVETAEGKAAAGEPFIVSIWGHDRNDIIATFARIFAEQRINVEGLKAFRIEDDQSLQVFEVVIPEQVDTRSLHRIMGERAKRMGLRLSMQHAAIFEAIHRVRVV